MHHPHQAERHALPTNESPPGAKAVARRCLRQASGHGRRPQPPSPVPRSTDVGGIDASRIPHLTSARLYERRSIFRTTRPTEQGIGCAGFPGQGLRQHTASRNGDSRDRWRLRSPAGHRRTPKASEASGPEQERSRSRTGTGRRSGAVEAPPHGRPNAVLRPAPPPPHHDRPTRTTTVAWPFHVVLRPRPSRPNETEPTPHHSTAPLVTRWWRAKDDRRCTCPRCAHG